MNSATDILAYYMLINVVTAIDNYIGIKIMKTVAWKNFDYVFDRTTLPSEIKLYLNHNIHSERWYKNNLVHRGHDKPAVISYYKNGILAEKLWMIRYFISRQDNPAILQYYNDGAIKYQAWVVDNFPHRLEGPAQIEYYDNGCIRYESFWIHGKHHRVNNPAYIQYTRDGLIESEMWFENNECTRRTGNLQGKLPESYIHTLRFCKTRILIPLFVMEFSGDQ